MQRLVKKEKIHNSHWFPCVILPHEKFLQFDWLRAVVLLLNFKITTRENYKPFAGSSINK